MSQLFFSLISEYYEDGIATVTQIFLKDMALANDDGNQVVAGVHINSDWYQFPELVTEEFSKPPQRINKLYRVLGPHEHHIFDQWDSLFYFMLTENKVGELVYVGKFIDWKKTGVTIGDFDLRIYRRAAFISIGMSIVFSFILFFILKIVIQPLEDLKHWANRISKEPIDSANPEQVKFRYKEFSDIANVIYNSIQREKSVIEREKEFLAYSSHELRSPLALLKGNSELLKKLIDTNNEKQCAAVERIEIATQTMTRLVETLLRLGANEEQALETEIVDLEELVREKLEQAKYLLKGKEITLSTSTITQEIEVPLVPCEIVITNLIGNAFQHAHHGEIKIEQTKTSLLVENYSPDEIKHTSKGFGLGLILVEEICKKYQWQLQIEEADGRYFAKVQFLNN